MKLRDWLEKNCINVSAFCRKSGLATHTVYKVIRGKAVTLKTAAAISKATKGAVSLEDIANNVD
jgi:predicted transcriptional regulator